MAEPLALRGVKRVALIRALPGLGDFLCAVPAFRALRSALPSAEVVLVGSSQGRLLAERFSRYIDRLVVLPPWPGLPEDRGEPAAVPPFLETMVAERFDLAIQMHGSGTITNHIAALLGATQTYGYYLPGQWCPDPQRYLPWSERQPEPRKWLDLLSHVGVPSRGEYLEFPLHETDLEEFDRLAVTHGLERGAYVCIHPGAAPGRKKWPPDRFARVADWLGDRGYRVVVTGTEEDRDVTRLVLETARTHAVDLTGVTSLGTLAALLRHARMLVCNDTGVSHLAAALGVPSVVVFNASDPARWAPANRRLHRTVLNAPGGYRIGGWNGSPDVLTSVLSEAEDILAHATPARPAEAAPAAAQVATLAASQVGP